MMVRDGLFAFRAPGAEAPWFFQEQAEGPWTLQIQSFDRREPKRTRSFALFEQEEAFWQFATKRLANVDDPWENSTTEEAYKQGVKEAVAAMKAGSLDKVVLSRIRREPLPQGFSLASFFHCLCETYPNAYVYFLADPTHGLWMGASPELLLEARDGQLESVSLAGTRSRMAEEDFGWKEEEEQAMVTQYIRSTFESLGLKVRQEGPEITDTGWLKHLKTRFLSQYESAFNPSTLAAALHPTPAVGGLPLHAAVQWIAKLEAHARRLYAGYLALEFPGNQFLGFVNLRCLQLGPRTALLYAGAGLTHLSDPELEWQETELKCQTLLNCL